MSLDTPGGQMRSPHSPRQLVGLDEFVEVGARELQPLCRLAYVPVGLLQGSGEQLLLEEPRGGLKAPRRCAWRGGSRGKHVSRLDMSHALACGADGSSFHRVHQLTEVPRPLCGLESLCGA